jgi:hypothetical protein
MLRTTLQIGLAAALAVAAVPAAQAGAASNNAAFPIVVSPGAAKCLPRAVGRVTIAPRGAVENMHVEVGGLPANTDFDFFVIQVPNKPFGLSWYQGDLETDGRGNGVGDFVGRFNIETFIVAPGVAPAPLVFKNPPFPDAESNPATPPVQIAHLGLWFNSPTGAAKAGCPATVTPFNGTHNAGIQAMNTGTFKDLEGPLLQVR